MESNGTETGRQKGSEQHEAMPPRTEVKLSVPPPTIVTSLAAQSVFSAKTVEDAFQYLVDHLEFSKVSLTVHQCVDIVEASIKVAQVAGTTINTQVENMLRILEARL